MASIRSEPKREGVQQVIQGSHILRLPSRERAKNPLADLTLVQTLSICQNYKSNSDADIGLSDQQVPQDEARV